MRRASGDHAYTPTPTVASVTAQPSPPPAGLIQICGRGPPPAPPPPPAGGSAAPPGGRDGGRPDGPEAHDVLERRGTTVLGRARDGQAHDGPDRDPAHRRRTR